MGLEKKTQKVDIAWWWTAVDLSLCLYHVNKSNYQFFFPRMKKELPSGMGTIFSLGPENSGFKGATPEKRKDNNNTENQRMTKHLHVDRCCPSSRWIPSLSPSSPSIALSSSFSCQSSSSFYRQKHVNPSTLSLCVRNTNISLFTPASSSSFSLSSSHSSSSSFFSLGKKEKNK